MKKLQWTMWYPADQSRTNYEASGENNHYSIVQRRTNRKVYLKVNGRLAAECKNISDAEVKAAEVEALRL